MEDLFLSYWFGGFEKALEQMDEANRNALLAQCGKACSNSYTRQIYSEEYHLARDISDFILRLKARFPESDFRIMDDGAIELSYHYCACDLVTKGYLQTPLLCECSRQSLRYNWASALGTQDIVVELIHSILGGSDRCTFRIRKAKRC